MNRDQAHFNADSPRFDWLVVTASNEKQALSYKSQLSDRAPADGSDCEINGCRKVLIVADPQGKRAGSGGSTFAVLVELAREMLKRRPMAKTISELLSDQNVLILHSGGDSRRLPPYAATGKIFVPVPALSANGTPQCLFDLVLRDFCSIPPTATARLTIGAGDLLLRIAQDALQFEAPGVIGVSCDSPPERGTRHGVYITDSSGSITGFLQKPKLETLQLSQAISTGGKVKVDTGVLSIDWPTMCRWLESLGLRVQRGEIHLSGLIFDIMTARAGSIDLYEHVLCMLAPPSKFTVVPNTSNPATDAALASALIGTSLSLAQAPHCEFLHIGTSRELLELGTRPIWGIGFPSYDDATLLSSDVVPFSATGPTFIENCESFTPLKLGGDNLLIGMPIGATQGTRLEKQECAAWIPIDEDKWTLIRYPLDYDWKSLSQSKILGIFAGSSALAEASSKSPHEYLEAIMPGSADATAFHARLWLVGSISHIEAIENRLHLASPEARAAACEAWLSSERISVAQITSRAHLGRIKDQHSRLTRRWLSSHAMEAIRACPLLSTARILEICKLEPDLRAQWTDAATRLPDHGDPSLRARCARIASVLEADSITAPWTPRVRAELSSCVSLLMPAAASPPQSVNEVSVSLPARIDLAGGWSDTPPICDDSGGLVINLAIRIGQPHPVRVKVRRTEQSSIVVRSLDQNQTVELPLSSPLRLTEAGDWSSLARAAIFYTMLPQWTEIPLGEYVSSGLEITFESGVPKGSGLGTSSILAAALVTALNRLLNSEQGIELHDVCRRVSTIEQAIGSCGGWQDQYGGLVPGLKALETFPGFNQTPIVTQFSLNSNIGDLLRSRTLLYYTGQQRLAANILQKFVSHYLDRDPSTLRVIRGIQHNARQLKRALLSDDPVSCTKLITEYWLLKRQIDPSASNPMIDGIVAAAQPYIDGYLLPGAGGGGFLLFIAKSTESKQLLMKHLSDSPPNPQAAFYPIEFDTLGPQITVD